MVSLFKVNLNPSNIPNVRYRYLGTYLPTYILPCTQAIIQTDYLGADSDDEEKNSDSEEEEEEEEEDEEEQEQEEGEQEQELVDDPPVEVELKENRRRKQKKQYEVGQFVTAFYEGKWLIAQVDIDQDKAGHSHVNLNYMEWVGQNQFKWPTRVDLLLTLRDDILTVCSAPILTGSTIRASNVGLLPSEARKADAALALVVYLQPIIFLNFLYLNITSILK